MVQQQGLARVHGAKRGPSATVGKRTNGDMGLDMDYEGDDNQIENGTKMFVTFYITNFPERANYWFLRKGFEVCGILDDVTLLRGVMHGDKRMVL